MSAHSISRSCTPRRLLALAALLVAPPAAHANVHHPVAPVHHAAGQRPVARAAAQHTARATRGQAPARRPVAEDERAASPSRHRADSLHANTHRAGTASGRLHAAAQDEDAAPLHTRKGRQNKTLRTGTATARLEARDRSTTKNRNRNREVASESNRSLRLPITTDAADRSTQERVQERVQDRVHAWYANRNASSASATQEENETASLPQHGRVNHAALPAKDAATDLATTAPKATADDFARAAAAQRLTIQSAAEQSSRQTTAADDAADAASHIPSTAPTEREPAPFVHGGSSSLAVPAGRRAGTASVSDAAVLAARPIVLATGSSPRAVSAAATLAEPTPQVRLPAPPAATGRKPAIAAVSAGNAHPVLEPAVTAGMADETFDDDTPATANTAIRLATTGVASHGRAADTDDTGPLRPVVALNVLDGSGRLMLLPPMKGTHEILVHQNQMAVVDGLERVQNDAELANMRRTRLLVALPDEDGIYPNDALPYNRRYARPWTVQFLRDLARSHYARFGTPLIVTSAVRTVAFQRQLVRVNGNAAPPSGDVASPHLYGQAIDLAKHGMSLTEITWMRAYLTPVEDEGKIDVEEEFQQACFHISVYRRYLGAPAPRKAAPATPALLQAKAVQPPPAAEKKHHLPIALLATHLP